MASKGFAEGAAEAGTYERMVGVAAVRSCEGTHLLLVVSDAWHFAVCMLEDRARVALDSIEHRASEDGPRWAKEEGRSRG